MINANEHLNRVQSMGTALQVAVGKPHTTGLRTGPSLVQGKDRRSTRPVP
jgi:hypothetical protein